MDEDEYPQQGAQQPVNVFDPGVINIEAMVDLLFIQVFFKIRRQLAFVYRRDPAAKTGRPVGTTHTTLCHPHHSAGQYYQHHHSENKPCVTGITPATICCGGNLSEGRLIHYMANLPHSTLFFSTPLLL